MNSDAEKIYLYFKNRSLLSDDDVKEIENRMKSDDNFSELVKEIQEIQKEFLSSEWSDIDSGKLFDKVTGKSKTNIIELKSILKENENNFRLAAMSDRKNPDDFIYENTYASAEEFVLIRVLKNHFSNEYKFYLICEDMSIVKNALLRFDKTDGDFIADDNGVVTFHEELIPKDIDIKIHIPVARFDVDISRFDDSNTLSEIHNGIRADIVRERNRLIYNFINDFLKNKSVYAFFDNRFPEFVKLDVKNENSVSAEFPYNGILNVKLIIIEE